MKVSKRFRISFGSKSINSFFRVCDFFKDSEGIAQEETFVIFWKEGEIVDEKRVQQTIVNLRLAFEQQGQEVSEIMEVQ